MGFGPVWKGCWAAKRRRLYGYPVNRWSTERTPNGTKLDRRSPGAIPRPLGKTRAIPRKFNTHSRKERRGERWRTWECRIAKWTTGKMLGCKFYENDAEAMHMMP